MSILTPAQRAQKSREEDAKRREANKYVFPKGNGDDADGKGFHGKIVKCEDAFSQKKGTPVWEVTVLTNEKKADGKKVEIKFNFWKSDKSLDFLYKALELAGADLSGIPAREADTEKHDAMVNKCFEKLEDINARIRFSCAHTVRKADPTSDNINFQKDGLNVNFYLREFALIDGELPLKNVLAIATPVPPVSGAKKSKAPVIVEEESDVEIVDSAFSDDD